MIQNEKQGSEARVVGFNSPFSFEIGDIAVAQAEDQLDIDQAYTYIEVLELVRELGNHAAIEFFKRVGCGEIDMRTGVPGEVVRFTANRDSSIVANQGSDWSWLKE